MTQIEVFQFPATGQQIRTVARDGEPLFCVADVCRGLQHTNPSVALKLVDEDDRVKVDLRETDSPTLNRTAINPEMWFVTESGFFALALASQAPGAKVFRRWVTHEVLPAIRKTGRYEVAEVPRSEIAKNWYEAELKAEALAARAVAAEETVAVLAPKAEQADFHRSADGLVPVGDFANKLKAWAKETHNVRVIHPEVWDFLAEIRLVIRGEKIRNNRPTAFATDRGFIKVKETEYHDREGVAHVSFSSRLTPAGEGWAWDRAVRRIAEHGSLRPPTSLDVAS